MVKVLWAFNLKLFTIKKMTMLKLANLVPALLLLLVPTISIAASIPRNAIPAISLTETSVSLTSNETVPYDEHASLMYSAIPVDGPNPLDITCFQPTKGVELLRARINDCDSVALGIIRGDKIRAPISWGVKKEGYHGFEVPYVWPPHKTCRVQIGPETPDAEDNFSPKDVADGAVEIIKGCLENQPNHMLRLGGTAKIGPKKIMRVTILGTKVSISSDVLVE